MSVKVDSLRSADPPNKLQTFFDIAASACEAETRVASESFGVKVGSSASHPCGKSLASAALDSPASAECLFAQVSNFAFHALSNSSPRSTHWRRCAGESLGTKNSRSAGHP